MLLTGMTRFEAGVSKQPLFMTTPTHSLTRTLGRLAVAGLAFALTVGLSATTAFADQLDDQRAALSSQMSTASANIANSKATVQSASERLRTSQAKLNEAKAKLAYVQMQLADAKRNDAAVAAELAAAQADLATASRDVAKGKADVEEQRQLISNVAKAAFQQQNSLVGLELILASQTSGELSKRLQWNTTIFDTVTAEMDRLKVMQVKLQAAEDRMKAIEAMVAEKKAAAEAQVSRISQLTASAASQQAAVAALVATNAANESAAKAELAAQEAEYRQLLADQAAVLAAIRARDAAARTITRVNHSAGESAKGFIYPVDAALGSPYGMRFHPILGVWRMHYGQDFTASCGQEIYAVADGRVASAGWNGGFGNFTVIDHGVIDGHTVSTGSAHQSRIVVSPGQWVSQGQVIGYVGTTGLSTGCHLHFEVYEDGSPVNPLGYLP